MRVICISGKAQHGKDTVAKMLYDNLSSKGHKVLITHCADLLKYICRTFFDWDGEKDDKGRTLLQHIGTDVVRKQKPDFWVNFIKSVLELFKNEWDYVLIPDCRFLNEYELLKNAGIDTMLARVERAGYDNGLTNEQRQHESETALDSYNCDYYILNLHDLDYLENQVKQFVEEKL